MAIGRLNIGLTGVQPGGLAKVIPSSVAVGSGSGSVDSNGTVSFSGASSTSINGCFTSTYRNYKVIVNANTSVDSYIQMRARASGTDNTAGNYGSGFVYQNTNVSASTPTQDVQGNNTSSSWYRIGYFITGDNPYQFDIFQPQITGKTYGTFQQSRQDGVVISGGFIHTASTSFDGFTIFPTSGTFTGTIQIYGYVN